MHQASKMGIHMTLGSEEGLHFLADTNLIVTSNPAIVQNIIAESKFQQDTGNDPILVFHFYVEQGKQKQAIAYINQAHNETIDKDLMSPMQRMLKKPSEQDGTVEIIENPGCIILKYRFFGDVLNDQNEITNLQTEFNKFDKATLRLTTSLKGGIKHNNNNRTNIKVDYVDLNIFSDQISPSDFSKIMDAMKMEEEEVEFFKKIPILQMIGNLKSAQLEIKLASFRQLRSYYIEAGNEKYKQKQNKPFPYVNRGIFRNQVTAFAVYSNKVAVKFDAHYNGEDVLMRLLKVTSKFWFQFK